jgi:hypothetical protein
MEMVEVEELSGRELLDHAEQLAATARWCEVEILRVAGQSRVGNYAPMTTPTTA